MNKRELAILEKAFSLEISGHSIKGHYLLQTKSKLAHKLANEGLLDKCTIRLDGGSIPVTVEGYELTHAGRYAYCSSCGD